MSDANRSARSEVGFLAKHSVIYGVGNLLSRIVAFVMLPLYTRKLTPFDYGVLELIDTTTGMIGLVAGLGVAGAMSRFYFDYDEVRGRNRVVSTTLILLAITAGVLIALLLPVTDGVAGLLFDRRDFADMLVIALVTLGLGLLIDAAQTYLRMLQRSYLYVSISLANLVMSVALNIYFVVFRDAGVYGILLSSLITKLVIAVPLLIYVLRTVGVSFDVPLARQMYRFSLPLIPSDLASTAISYSDRYFINHFLSTADAGIYGLAQKLGTVMHVLVTSPFLLAYLPRRFEIAKNPNAPQVFSTTFDYHMLLLAVLSTVLALFAPEILVVMATAPYYPAADYIPVIAASMIVLGMKYHFQFGMLYAKRTEYMMYVNIASATVHIAMNALLIRPLGLWGALAASTAAYAANTYLSLRAARQFYQIDYQVRRNVTLLTLCVCVVVAGTTVQLGFLYSIFAKGGLFLLFLAALFITGVVSRAEAEQASAWLRRTLLRARPVETQ